MRNIGALWGFVGCLVTFGCGGETGKQQTCADDCTGQPSTQTGGASAGTGAPHAGGSQAAQGTGGSGASATVASKSSLSACSWPAELDGDATSRDYCHASRRMISCTDPGGGGQACTTDGASTCPGAEDLSCKDKCASDEYVAACGGVGPGNVPEPPPGCTSAGAIPAGIEFYCCPCGS